MEQQDKFAAGMTAYVEEHFETTPELDQYQYGLFKDALGGRALEIGAGSGRISILAAADPNLTELVLSEPSDHFFKYLKKRIAGGDKLKVVQSESRTLAAQYRNYFDCIYSVDVVEHIEDDKSFLDDCYEMLKPGGKCILLVPALQFLYSDFDKSIGHHRRYSKSLMRATVAKTKLKIGRMAYHNFPGVFASYYFFKVRKLDYQTPSNKKQFFFLASVYSRFFVPVIRFVERIVPVPLGLNLTVTLVKPA